MEKLVRTCIRSYIFRMIKLVLHVASWLAWGKGGGLGMIEKTILYFVCIKKDMSYKQKLRNAAH